LTPSALDTSISEQRLEQDHQRIKRGIRPMLGCKSFRSVIATLSGIEMIHMLHKYQLRDAHAANLSITKQFEILVTTN